MPRYGVVPALMATQHPDSAYKYFTVEEEVKETLQDLIPLDKGGYGCDEKMIDYEGKLTPFLQPRWIIKQMHEKLKESVIPEKDFVLSIRVPSADLESIDKQILALLAGILANIESEKLYEKQATKYVIHPMTYNVRQLVAVQRRVNKLLNLAREELGLPKEEDIEVIPLIEDVRIMFDIDEFIKCFRTHLSSSLGIYRDSIRVLLGKSDSALAYGHLSSVIGLKVALWKLNLLSEKEGLTVYPIIGSGALPFRGHLSPYNIKNFVKEYQGYFTVTIQSGFRFDFPRNEVIKALKVLIEGIGKPPRHFNDLSKIRKACKIITEEYLKGILPSLEVISEIADLMPKRRERLGRATYGRTLDTVLHFVGNELRSRITKLHLFLPRAIRYTAALYTIGVPPTFIGTGRGLYRIKDIMDTLIDLYPSLKTDLMFDAQYLCLDIASKYLSPKSIKLIEEDYKLLMEYFDIDISPDPHYRKLLTRIRENISKGMEIVSLVNEAARIRRSLG